MLGEDPEEPEDVLLSGRISQNQPVSEANVFPQYMSFNSHTLQPSSIVNIMRQRDPYIRQQLFEPLLQNVEYSPNYIQSGGYPQLMLTVNNLSGIINTPTPITAIREYYEGVVLNNQDLICCADVDVDDIRTDLLFSHIADKVSRCHLRHTGRNFITKEYCHSQWHSEELEIPIMCDVPELLKPLGIIWNSHKIYLFLPYFNGKTLADIITRRKTLTIDEVDVLGHRILCGVRDFHRQNFLHRNISPYHVMISRRDQKIKLVGCGSLCRLNDSVSWLPSSRGSNHYCAPELARGESHTDKCDVYSTGCTLLSALTGRIPYFSSNHSQVHDSYYRTLAFEDRSAKIHWKRVPFPMQSSHYNCHDPVIGSGAINPHSVLRDMEQNPVIQMITDMTNQNQHRRPSVEDLFRTYYRGTVPMWNAHYFGTRSESPVIDPLYRPRPDLSFIAQLPQNGILVNIPSQDLLDSAGVQEEEEEVIAPAVEEDLPLDKADSMHNLDSGRLTFSDFRDSYEIAVIVNDGDRQLRFPRDSTEFGSCIYKIVLDLLKISGGIILWHGNTRLEFDTSLSSFPQPEIHFRLERLNKEEVQHSQRQRNDSLTVQISPDMIYASVADRFFSQSPEADREHRRNLATNREPSDNSQQGRVIMGAAYDGNDHVVFGSLEERDTSAQKTSPMMPPRPSAENNSGDQERVTLQDGNDRAQEENHSPPETSTQSLLQQLSNKFSYSDNSSDNFSDETLIDRLQTDRRSHATGPTLQQQCREVKPLLQIVPEIRGVCSIPYDLVGDEDSGEEYPSAENVERETMEDEENRFVENEEEDDAVSGEAADVTVNDPVGHTSDHVSQEVEDTLNDGFLDSGGSDSSTEYDSDDEENSECAENEEEYGNDDDDTNELEQTGGIRHQVDKDQEPDAGIEEEGDDRSEFEDSGLAAETSADTSTFSEMNLNITDEGLSPIKEDFPDLDDDNEEN